MLSLSYTTWNQMQASTWRENYDLETPHPENGYSHAQQASLERNRHYVVKVNLNITIL
jgi:hypothetical protein